MKKVLSFHDYIQKTNEGSGDLFGVTTSPSGNFPTGYSDYEDDYEGERDIDPVGSPKHKLKLIEVSPGKYTTNSSDVALLEDPQGKKYIWYWGSHLDRPELWEGTLDEEGDIDENSVEVVANRLDPKEFGKGLQDWESEQKEIVEIDTELAEELIDWLDEWEEKTRDSNLKTIKSEILKHVENLGEGLMIDELEMSEYDESETDGKPGDEESETDETTEVMEAEGIHPAIRQKLMDYLKDNPDATYPEAKRFISEKIAGWNLTSEDFEEAKKMM